jgi:hypothetical protein
MCTLCCNSLSSTLCIAQPLRRGANKGVISATVRCECAGHREWEAGGCRVGGCACVGCRGGLPACALLALVTEPCSSWLAMCPLDVVVSGQAGLGCGSSWSVLLLRISCWCRTWSCVSAASTGAGRGRSTSAPVVQVEYVCTHGIQKVPCMADQKQRAAQHRREGAAQSSRRQSWGQQP